MDKYEYRFVKMTSTPSVQVLLDDWAKQDWRLHTVLTTVPITFIFERKVKRFRRK